MPTTTDTEEARVQYLRNLGLSDDEIRYIMTPLKDMKPQQRLSGFNILDKRNNLVAAENDVYRAELLAKEQAEHDGIEEIELDDMPANMSVDPHAHLGEEVSADV